MELSRKEKEQLFRNNMALAYSFANRYPQEEREDLAQEGLAALWKAIDSYDETRGMPFSTYAAYIIRRDIGTYRGRKSNRMEALEGEYIDNIEPLHSGRKAEDECISEIISAVNGLPNAAYRLALRYTGLRGHADITQQELAKILGVSREAVAQWVLRAKNRLRSNESLKELLNTLNTEEKETWNV